MKRIGLSSVACLTLLFALTSHVFAATPNPTSAVVNQRVFNDCPSTTLNVVNNYPALLSIEDAGLACLGGANLTNWSFSTDGVSQAHFDNDADYRFSTDLVISGAGNGESGIRISPWWSPDVDGRFNVRVPDGEIACFAGRLPFYSFTAQHGITYTKGNTIHLEVIYKPNTLTLSSPATIEYKVTYLGNDYTSGALPFDQANPAEDPPHGLWGQLNDARVGGYLQSFMAGDGSASVKATYSNIRFVICPDEPRAMIKNRIFNDCPSTLLTTVNQYPSLVSIEDASMACLGGANLTNWTYNDGIGAALRNDYDFRFAADLVLSGTGRGESGLRLSPWWSQDVDGRFNVRIHDGEIACFGGRLPFYSFTGSHGISYTSGTPIHLEMVYRHNGLSSESPATIEYKVTYLGNDYASGPIAFDEANPNEDPPHGLWGMLNDARAGGYLQSFMDGDGSASVKATYTNIEFEAEFADVAVDVTPNRLNFQSGGNFITAHITPPAPFGPEDIDASTLRLNGQLGPSPGAEIDEGALVVKFNRTLAQNTIGNTGTATVTGEVGGVCFSGSDAMKVVHVSSPTAGSSLSAGSTVDVQWETPSDVSVSSASVYVSIDDGDNWSLVAGGVANTESHSWTVPSTSSDEVRVAVVLDDGSEEGLVGVSGSFEIAAPVGVEGPAVEFGLRGITPNPSNGQGVNVRFSLANARRATLALFDVGGRRVAFREVGSLGPGNHTINLARNLPVGMYVVQLSQDGRNLTTRAAVVR
jgi:hypothetical protein